MEKEKEDEKIQLAIDTAKNLIEQSPNSTAERVLEITLVRIFVMLDFYSPEIYSKVLQRLEIGEQNK